MDQLSERAREVGRLLGQTPEYDALRRGNQRLHDDRDAVTYVNRLGVLEESFALALRRGVEPPEEEQQEYQQLTEQLQRLASYQAMAAAQSNFDRLMARVNEEIGRGVESAQQSRIILAP